MDDLDAYPPQIVADAVGGTLRFSGWRDKAHEARFRPGDEALPAVVALADVPQSWRPPEDGRTWLVLPPLAWSTAGLPDPDGYCMREQALAVEQAGRVLDRLMKRHVRLVVVAEGECATAAMGLALGNPERVAGLVLVEPKGFAHMAGGRVVVDGKEGAGLARLAAGNPRWRAGLERAMEYYDLCNLCAEVKAPVVSVVGKEGGEDWLADAQAQWGWRGLDVNVTRPVLAGIMRARWFGALWDDCMAATSAGETRIAQR
jgi:pimeloyl-ACP methyl ester carboxylesterase